MMCPRESALELVRLALAGFLGIGAAGCSILVDDGGYAVGSQDAGLIVLHSDASDASDAPSPTAVTMVSSGFGYGFWCAVTVDGSVKCWGDNFYGNLGDGTTTSSAAPVTVKQLPPASQVSLGPGTACALTTGGAVYCWGDGEVGELGNGGTTQIQKTPVPVMGLQADVTAVSVGYYYACALKNDGTVWCWGTPGEGIGGTATNLEPIRINGLLPATAVSAGFDTTCVILTGGAVSCWGAYAGQSTLGNGSPGPNLNPVSVSLSGGATDISVGGAVVCVVTDGGAVECWGNGGQGELGQGNTTLITSGLPLTVIGLESGVKSVSAGVANACALKGDGTVWCWGVADDAELGNGPPELNMLGTYGLYSGVPVQVENTQRAASLGKGAGLAPCLVTETGGVQCWGKTCEFAGTPVTVALPFVVHPLNPVPALSVAIGGDETEGFACAVTSQHALACWGSNDKGELGNSANTPTTVPVLTLDQVLLSSASTVSAASYLPFGCAVGAGEVKCWGDGTVGELGDGQNPVASMSTPQLVSAPPDVELVSVSVGGLSACALSSTGGLYCWGDNSYGQLGDGTTNRGESPQPVFSSGVESVSVGLDFACAIMTGGTVECWGDNTLGELGTGGAAVSVNSSPKPVPSLSGVTALSAGWFSACAIGAGGSISCWGYGDDCELGNVSCTSSAIPVPVLDHGTTTPVMGATAVAVGYNSACAIVGGGAGCWGSAALGAATLSSQYTASSFGGVTGLSSGVTTIAVGHTSACAIANGLLYCWGENTGGQLGTGGAVNDDTATAIPGFP